MEKHLTNIDGININIDYRKVKRIRLTLKSEKEVLIISPYGVSQDYLSSRLSKITLVNFAVNLTIN